MNAFDASKLWRSCISIARRVAGVPDYEAYLAHLRERHPERPVPTHAEFFAERQRSRYRGNSGRCC